MVLHTTKTPNDLPQKHQTIYHKNTKRFTTKTPNDLPQKYQTKCHKNTKQFTTKTPNEMRNPQEISNFG